MKKRMFCLFIVSITLLMCACGNQAVSTNKETEELVAVVEAETTDDTIEVISEIETTETETRNARIPMIMVDGQLYYSTGKESTVDARCGVMDGEITSSVDSSEIPTKDNQSNFGSGYGYQYGIQGTIEVQMEDGKWYVYEVGSGEGKLRFGDRWYDKGELSEETIKWLYWYNCLSEEEQLTVNAVPKELIDAKEYIDVETEDALAVIRMENPSWEYYTAESVVSGTKPFGIKLLEETPNNITDTDAWFEKNELQLTGNSNEEEYGCYIDYDGVIVCITKGGEVIAELEFTEYMYAPDLVEADRDFVDERVRDAKIRNGVLYVSVSHLTYAESAPSNAYIAAISLDDYSVIWKSEPLVCNSYNFEIVDDIIFTGYGFTAEPDYLFQIDRLTGTVLETYKLKSKADYIIYKDDKLYVRTYDTDYVFEVQK